jgi:uncharacterized protein (TIGR03067 family)
MRQHAITLLLFIGVGFTTISNSPFQTGKLNGTWVPVQQEMNGRQLPPASFQTQKLIIGDSTYIFNAESEDKGALKYADGKMDIWGKEGVNTGKHFTAIYKYENERLTICYNLAGDSYPEAFETTDKPLLFLAVYKKE